MSFLVPAVKEEAIEIRDRSKFGIWDVLATNLSVQSSSRLQTLRRSWNREPLVLIHRVILKHQSRLNVLPECYWL